MKVVDQEISVIRQVIGEDVGGGHFKHVNGVAGDDTISARWFRKVPRE